MKIKATKIEIIIYIILFIAFILASYFSPKVILFLFTSPIGIGILLFAIATVALFNRNLGFGLCAVFVILYVSISLSMKPDADPNTNTKAKVKKNEEGFSNQEFYDSNIILKNGWTSSLVEKFLSYQNSYNPNYYFDINIIQQQATPEEANEYLQTGKWPWSPEIQHLYKTTISKDPLLSFSPGSALNNAQQIYNQTAIKEVLAWDTKEGHFILDGVTIGHTKNLPKNINNMVRCGLDGNPVKVINRKATGAPGFMVENYIPVEPSALPALINGFSFLKEPCNPCAILNEDILTYNCPFSLNIGDGGEVSPIWAHLWGLVPSNSKKAGQTGGRRSAKQSKKIGVVPLNQTSELDTERTQINTNYST